MCLKAMKDDDKKNKYNGEKKSKENYLQNDTKKRKK